MQQKSLHSFLPHSSAPYSTPFTTTQAPSHTQPSNSPRPSSSTIQINRHRASISTTPPPIYSILPEAASSQRAGISAPSLRPDRPALVVSSTSWTPDEDFDILTDALRAYEEIASSRSASDEEERLPKLLVLITGKGPLKDKYMTEIGKLQEGWKWVKCVSLWLEAEDYPILLGIITLLFLLCLSL